MKNVTKIYTIGYSGFKIDDFVVTLKKYGVKALIDVRSVPFSSFFRDYNSDSLSLVLNKNNIIYRNYKNEFGARQDDSKFYPNGYLDFEMFSTSLTFKSGVEKLCRGMEKGYTFALMCAEKDPMTCHRTILVARAFHKLGLEVLHILPNGGLEKHSNLENRLLDKYYPERGMPSLFEEQQNDIDLLYTAYQLQNKEIGYKLEDDSNGY